MQEIRCSMEFSLVSPVHEQRRKFVLRLIRSIEFPAFLPFHKPDNLEAQYQALLSTSKCSDLDCLRKLPEAALRNASVAAYGVGYKQGRYAYGDFWMTPSVDRTVIKQLPSESFRQGHFRKVPFLTDHSTLEGRSISPCLYLW